MSRHCWAAALAAVVVAAFTLAPAVAGERATLRVTARVVDRCTIEVPPWVPPWVWRDRQHELWRLVHHRCHGERPFWVHAKRVLLERLRERLRALHDDTHGNDRGRAFAQGDDRGRGHDHGRNRDQGREHDLGRGHDGRGRAHERRHPTRDDVVLITITY